jgi:hypothetical protein
MHVVFGLHPPVHLAENKHNMFSKVKFLSLNCCIIDYNQVINLKLYFNNQRNSNRLIPRVFDNMLCFFSASWAGNESQKQRMLCKQPEKTIRNKIPYYHHSTRTIELVCC